MIPHWPRWSLPFHAQPTARLDEHVLALRTGSVNAYLYARKGVLLAFDAGLSEPLLQRALVALHQDPAQVQAVFLTHGDSDHVGGLGLFPQATLYLGAGEQPLVTQAQRRMAFSYEPRLPREPQLLPDGERITVGGVVVEALATPGHTPGSTSYLVDGRYLFVGDALSLRRGQLAPFVRLINQDQAAHLRSIAKLAALDGVALLCTGHSGVSHAWDRLVQPWREAGA